MTTVPEDRFDSSVFVDVRQRRPGKSCTSAGGFLDDLAGFDAEYFGISPREASRMDPQQRLLLEMAVEALDDAGFDHSVLAGSDTGVFVGVSCRDYGELQMLDAVSVSPYSMSGSAGANTANRISHAMDWHGESEAVDTACSSAMTALHRGCEYLRAGRSRLVLVGGCSVLINPFAFAGFSAASMLSPTGRCRTFSAAADGYVRSEGGGVVLLKRVGDAMADGDRIHAVILATATNNDGRTAGLALPNGSAQEALLREVYVRAGVGPDELSYLEVHGTGTPSGDPIECAAIYRALTQFRTCGPLPIGSVKSNLGHQEAAAGMAGLLKALLVLRHRHIPPTLHAEQLNPRIPFAQWQLQPAVLGQPLDGTDRPVAGVNSFGFGGANAHAVLATPATDDTASHQPGGRFTARRALPVLVTARTPEALASMAGRMAKRLSDTAPDEFGDLTYTAARRRGRHEHRAVVLASDPADAARALVAVARGEQLPGGAAEMEAVSRGKTAFIFSGNGSQWAGMGADLLEHEPVFRTTVEEADAALAPHVGWSVRARLADPSQHDAWLHKAEVAQPLLFALQAGLAALLEAYGITPSAVLGHSVGEIAAAYVAGALDLPSASLLVAERSTAQGLTAGQGRMAAIGLSEEEARKELAVYYGRLEIAGVNSSRDVTVSGTQADLTQLGRELTARDVFFRMLDLDYAYHSRSMDPIDEQLRTALFRLRPCPGTIPFVSCVTGALLPGEELDADYWWRNVREPVLLASGVDTLLAAGCDILVEVGPHPVLAPYLRRITELSAEPAVVVTTCTRSDDGPTTVRTAVARALAAGAGAGWEAVLPGPGRVVDLPAYPWQRQRHWNGDPGWWSRRGGNEETCAHPMLGARLPSAEPVWSGPLEPARLPWLADHRVDGDVVMPGAGYLEMAFAASQQLFDGPVEVEYLTISRAMILPRDTEEADLEVQVSLAGVGQTLRVAAREGAHGDWQEHARARARRLLRPVPEPLDIACLRDRLEGWAAVSGLYERAALLGLLLGPAFRALGDVLLGEREGLAPYRGDVSITGYRAHPALLDGGMQAGAGVMAAAGGNAALFLPVAVDAARLWRDLPSAGWIHVRLREFGELEASWDVTFAEEDGRIALELEGCRLRRFVSSAMRVQKLETVLRASPCPDDVSPSALPTPQTLLETTESRRAALAAAYARSRPAEVKRSVKEYQARLAARTVAEILPESGQFTVRDLLEAGVLPDYAHLTHLLISLAEEHGLAVRVAGEERWSLVDTPLPEAVAQAALRRGHFPHPGVMALYGRCGEHLTDVLCGRMDALDVLFSEADRHLLEQIYDEVADSRFINRTARELLRAAVRAWPTDQPLRILEVGGGTGGMTAELLEVLPPERTLYIFTDVSASFLPRTQARFSDYNFIDYRVLDLNRDIAGQGFLEGGFDLVVASNVLHATTDLRAALERVSRLLAAGGQLLAAEMHDPRLGAIIFGLLHGYWSFTDSDLRTASPLLTATQWAALLEECGFTDVHLVGASPEVAGNDHSVILARHEGACLVRRTVPPSAPTDWIVAAEQPQSALAQRLAAELEWESGYPARIVSPQTDTAGWAALVPDDGPPPHVVLLLDENTAAAGPEATLDEAVSRISIFTAIAACERVVSAVESALSLVTRPCGALPEPEAATHPRDAAVWGTARTFANEHPSVGVRRISFERGPDPVHDARRLARELATPTEDDEVVLTRRGRFTPLLVPRRPVMGDTEEGEREPYRLELRKQSLPSKLAWVPAERPELRAGEVAIAVRAAGLNYRDALLAAGMLPTGAEPATVARCLGLECSGVIDTVGPGVTGFAPGDRVFAFAPGALASHVHANARFVGHVPEGMDFTAAATLPVVFFTVHHSLEHLARLVPGETVLVHGGAGGIGLAVAQFAEQRGATVITTAGTPAKRGLLRLLGTEHVLDSRSLDFADDVRRLTGGRGVDVVVNSLAGESLTRSVELLRPGGRFIELGKRDVYGNSPLPLRLLRDNIAFFVVDVARLTDDAAVSAQFRDMAERVRVGTYRPLFCQPYPASRIAQAMHTLQHSRHLGKIVIDFSEAPAVERSVRPSPLDHDATYVLVGGISGIGAASAGWLAECGARHLALVGRRGMDTPGSAELVLSLEHSSAHVTVHAADVTDAAAMRRIWDAADAAGHPVGGVVHSTMVVDDVPLAKLTPERIRPVLAPKMLGAAVLDKLTQDRSTDVFLVYSSITAMLGGLGQAAYTAGNMYLEALVRSRRRARRPGLAVAWGVVAETGAVARGEELAEHLERFGLFPLPLVEARAALHEFMATGTDYAIVGRFDWGRMREVLPTLGSRFAAVLSAGGRGDGADPEELRRRLAGLLPDRAMDLVADVLVEELAVVLQTDPNGIDRSRRLDRLGLDSLMAAELVVAVRRRLGCAVPPLEIINSTDITDLARRTLSRLGDGAGEPAQLTAPAAAEPPRTVV